MVKILDMVKNTTQPMTEEDFLIILDKLEKDLLRVEGKKKEYTKEFLIALLLGYYSGLRLGEILSLKPNQINRVIYIEDRIHPLFYNWKKEYKNYIPLTISRRALQERIKIICLKCGLNPNYSFISLRAGFIIYKLKNGYGVDYLSRVLGYSRVKENRYIQSYFRKNMSLRKRFKILKKSNFTCQHCGRKAPDIELHIDHKTPIKRGGKNKLKNYQVLCSDCNLGKGSS